MPTQKILVLLTESKEPIKRRDLLVRLRVWGFKITDREMRALYSANPLIISKSHGVYLAKTLEEVEAFYRTERGRGLAILKRARAAKREFIKNHKAKEVLIVYSYNEEGQKIFV